MSCVALAYVQSPVSGGREKVRKRSDQGVKS